MIGHKAKCISFGYWNNIFPKIISANKDQIIGEHKEIITLTYTNNTVRSFQGSGTVWHELPLMKRCGAFQESRLSEISKYIDRYGNPYPVSHLKYK